MALRVGGENKRTVIGASIAGVGVVLALIYFFNQMFGGSSAPAPAPAPAATTAPTTAAATAPRTAGTAQKVAHVNLDPTLHTEWMAQAESISYTGKGRNIFSQSSAPVASNIPVPKGPARPNGQQPQIPQGPPAPPPPPPIDLKFFGFEASKSGSKRIFLLHGEDIFLAAEGDIVDHRYKVVKILPFSVQVEDIPYHNTQNLPLVQN